jgi:hypothetical protein
MSETTPSAVATDVKRCLALARDIEPIQNEHPLRTLAQFESDAHLVVSGCSNWKMFYRGSHAVFVESFSDGSYCISENPRSRSYASLFLHILETPADSVLGETVLSALSAKKH